MRTVAESVALAQTKEFVMETRCRVPALIPATPPLQDHQSGVKFAKPTRPSMNTLSIARPRPSILVQTSGRDRPLRRDRQLIARSLADDLALKLRILRRTAICALCGPRDYAKPAHSSCAVAEMSMLWDSA